MLGSIALRAGTSLSGMRSVIADHVQAVGTDSRNDAFERIQLVLQVAAAIAWFVPCGMTVVSEYQLGADAGYFSAGPCRLYVAEVAHEIHQARQSFCNSRIVGAAFFQFDGIENLAARREQPTESVGQRECYALACALV